MALFEYCMLTEDATFLLSGAFGWAMIVKVYPWH